MAALNLQEQEQLESLKGWWSDNGSWILGALLVVLVTVGGWRGWQYYQHQQATEALTLYSQFLKQLSVQDNKRIDDAAAAVMDKYASSAYAPRAALLAAQMNELSGSAEKAKTQLQWVIDHAGEPALKDVARLRLAAVLLDGEKYAEALQLLNTKHADSFDGLYADLKGDVLSAQGKTDEARSSYKLAYEKTDSNSVYRNLIQMKMDALGAAS